jgi:2-C-methyl-D-erythritol 4-phosphate cytidylyltransferase
VIVAAAGEGRRFGAGTPKQLVEIAGRPMIEWSLDRLSTLAGPIELREIVVAVPNRLLATFEERLSGRPRLRCVAGGASRGESVRRALDELDGEDDDDLVAVHDAARPALAAEDYERVVEAAAAHGAAVLGRPLTDTVKRLAGDRIEATLDRASLFRAETPQVFRRGLLRAAFAQGEASGVTDESALVEALLEGLGSSRVVAVTATRPNPKLTDSADLPFIEALLRGVAPDAGTKPEG